MTYTKRTAILLTALVLALNPGIERNAGTAKVYATTTREQIDQTQKDKEELEGKRDEIQDNIDGLKGEQKTLKGELNTLNTQLKDIGANLEELEGKIRSKEQEIADTQEALETAQNVEKTQYANMVVRVRKMYEHNDASYLNALVGSIFDVSTFSSLLNAADGYEKVADYDKSQLEQFKENRRLIEEQEALLQKERTELEELKEAAEAEQNKVSGLIKQVNGSIADYADQISDAEKQALAYEEEIRKKEEDLVYLRQKLAEEMALSKEAAEGVWRDISEVTFSDGDRYLLANLIYCEAGGEPYAGQLAVGSVVINRVLSAKFPDSVVGVIYQNRQFSPVASGRLDLALASNKATSSCYQAADEAMAGISNVGNCVFFRTPVDGLTGISIGGHIFY